MSQMHILVLHGPNLNMLGLREPEHYGATTLAEIDQMLVELGNRLGCAVQTFQSNHEGALIDRIHQAALGAPELPPVDGILINPGAYTHTSIAIRDALLAARKPVVEVHLSNIHKREPFRHRSMISDIAVGVVAGFGAQSYAMALRGLAWHLNPQTGV